MSDPADNPNPDAANAGLTLTPADIAALLDKLGLDPATADVAALLAKVDSLNGAAQDAQAAAGTAQSTLADLQSKYDTTIADLDAKQKELSDIYQQKAQAEADGILEQYAANFPPGDAGDKAKATIRSLLLADRQSAMTILDGMKRDQAESAEAGKVATPPAPVHDPGKTTTEAPGAADQQARADQISAIARQLMKKNPNISNTEAYRRAEQQVDSEAASA